ncbi:MAG: hypothetical protein IJH25_05905, partial [Clostridia bacterium]|nr:hypothetical protein [Clostridia bacterium]
RTRDANLLSAFAVVRIAPIRYDKIISLEYLGVTALGSGHSMGTKSMVTIGIGAYCHEEDADDVTLFMNREICLLSEREGLSII